MQQSEGMNHRIERAAYLFCRAEEQSAPEIERRRLRSAAVAPPSPPARGGGGSQPADREAAVDGQPPRELMINPDEEDDFLEELAFYGEFSYDLTDTLEITLGARRADIEQDFQRSERGTDDTPVSPKLVLAWTPSDNLMLYGGYATGFRPGNVNNNLAFYAETFGSLGLDASTILSGLFFDGDEVESYELGVKTTLFSGRVSIQSAAYFIEWEDMIVHEVNPAIGTGDVYNVNSGGADIKGLELDINAMLTDRLNIRLAGDVNDTKVTQAEEFSTTLQGSELIFAPDYSVSIAINYSLPLENGWRLDFYLDRARVAKQFVNSQNTLEIPGFERMNGRVTLHSPDEKWRIALYGTNLEDDQIIRGRTATGTLFWHDPRQIGFEFGYQL